MVDESRRKIFTSRLWSALWRYLNHFVVLSNFKMVIFSFLSRNCVISQVQSQFSKSVIDCCLNQFSKTLSATSVRNWIAKRVNTPDGDEYPHLYSLLTLKLLMKAVAFTYLESDPIQSKYEIIKIIYKIKKKDKGFFIVFETW